MGQGSHFYCGGQKKLLSLFQALSTCKTWMHVPRVCRRDPAEVRRGCGIPWGIRVTGCYEPPWGCGWPDKGSLQEFLAAEPSPQPSTLLLLRQGLPLAPNLPRRQGWLVLDSQGRSCLNRPSSGITSIRGAPLTFFFFFTWVLGIKLGSSWFLSRHFT